jgi:hypothetical protein
MNEILEFIAFHLEFAFKWVSYAISIFIILRLIIEPI